MSSILAPDPAGPTMGHHESVVSGIDAHREVERIIYLLSAIHIEAVYHSLMKSELGLRQPAAAFPDDSLLSPAAAGCDATKPQQAAAVHGYEPFQGICLTDTIPVLCAPLGRRPMARMRVGFPHAAEIIGAILR